MIVAGRTLAAVEDATSHTDDHVMDDVIAGAQVGDQEAFRQLYEAHKDKVYSVALRFSGDPATAADIAQDTFLKLFSRIGQFRGESSFDSWLYRAVVNACMDHHRRTRRLLPTLLETFDQFRAPQSGALDGLLATEQAERVQNAVGKLPTQQRMVVVLRYTEGLSYDEIAEVLECSPGTVASRLNRAHKTLERKLRRMAEEAGMETGGRDVQKTKESTQRPQTSEPEADGLAPQQAQPRRETQT